MLWICMLFFQDICAAQMVVICLRGSRKRSQIHERRDAFERASCLAFLLLALTLLLSLSVLRPDEPALHQMGIMKLAVQAHLLF